MKSPSSSLATHAEERQFPEPGGRDIHPSIYQTGFVSMFVQTNYRSCPPLPSPLALSPSLHPDAHLPPKVSSLSQGHQRGLCLALQVRPSAPRRELVVSPTEHLGTAPPRRDSMSVQCGGRKPRSIWHSPLVALDPKERIVHSRRTAVASCRRARLPCQPHRGTACESPGSVKWNGDRYRMHHRIVRGSLAAARQAGAMSC